MCWGLKRLLFGQPRIKSRLTMYLAMRTDLIAHQLQYTNTLTRPTTLHQCNDGCRNIFDLFQSDTFNGIWKDYSVVEFRTLLSPFSKILLTKYVTKYIF